MKCRNGTTLISLIMLLALGLVSMASAADSRPPNLVIILADDLGWKDLGCYGNTFNETPHIDRLAREGVRFSQFYAGPVCSPTRANLQSGQDQARFGITQHIPGHRRPFAKLLDPVVEKQLPLEVETFAERLSNVGYATGYFGKWHLGGTGFSPGEQGWETYVECASHTQPPKVTGTGNEQRTAAFLASKAEAFIAEHKDRPFVLQLSHYAVHIPLSSTPELKAKYEAKAAMAGYPSNPVYAGLLEELDQSVGRVVQAIDKAGLGGQTLIWFLSDNGGLVHTQDGTVVTSNAPLRGEKGTLYEGGIRIPSIVRWSGQVPAGKECETPAVTQDIHPTLVELGRGSLEKGAVMDGTSLAVLLKNPEAKLARSSLYWHLPHYHHSTPASAIRQDNWKLIEFYETGTAELYDLAQDMGEARDVASAHPQVVSQLKATLEAWKLKVQARLPAANAAYDPARATELAGGERKNKKGNRKPPTK